MSGLKPITVNTPTAEEAHIYAEDDAAIYQSIFGEDGVSTIGQACKATVLSNNKVRILDGVICVGGHFARVPYGDYIDCEIANGQSGKNRNDIIIARFETTGTGGIDKFTCMVKQGTAGTTATDPSITKDNLYQAGKVREFPLYRVKIEGLSITAVDQLFKVVPTHNELIEQVESLNSKKVITQSGITWVVKKYGNYFEAYGTYEGYVSANNLYAIDVALPFVVKSLNVAFCNPSYHAFYLSKWYVNEVQTYSKDKLNLCFQTANISRKTDFKFDLYVAGNM